MAAGSCVGGGAGVAAGAQALKVNAASSTRLTIHVRFNIIPSLLVSKLVDLMGSNPNIHIPSFHILRWIRKASFPC
jgi:hypothetical protein